MSMYQARGIVVGILWRDPEEPYLPTGFLVELDDTGATVPVEYLTRGQREAIEAHPAWFIARYVQLLSGVGFSEDMSVEAVRFDSFIWQ